jgi:hypothetical protein
LALQEAERSIKVREGDEIHEMPVIQAAHRARVKSALSGNSVAQRDLINQYGAADQERRKEIAEECEFWTRYVDAMRKAELRAKERGEPFATPIPHPDDITIDPERGAVLHGPRNEEEAEGLTALVKSRNVYIMRYVHDCRINKIRPGMDVLDHSAALAVALRINQCLPKRVSLSGSEIVSRLMRYDRMTKRALLRDTYRSLRSVGMPAQRGEVFPSIRTFIFILDKLKANGIL